MKDKDSTPGNGFNKGEDDDDSEPVNVTPAPIFDLALSKTLSPGQSASVLPGALVKFRLTCLLYTSRAQFLTWH